MQRSVVSKALVLISGTVQLGFVSLFLLLFLCLALFNYFCMCLELSLFYAFFLIKKFPFCILVKYILVYFTFCF